MPGENRIHKRVVGIQEIEHRTVIADHIFDKAHRLFEHCLAQLVIKAGEAIAVHRVDLFKAAEIEPVAPEFDGQVTRALILQHSPRLRYEDLGLL